MASNTPLDTQSMHRQLLRPPVLDILRATGFSRARPAVLDTVIDLTHRYLALLSTRTALQAQARCCYTGNNTTTATGEDEPEITVTDVRKALQDVGALHPQLSELEELARGGEEDMRGVDAFLDWARGDVNAEIRRIAGMHNAAALSATSDAAAAATTSGGGGGGGGSAADTIGVTTAAAAAETNVTEGGRKPNAAAAAAAAAAAEAEAILAAEGREDYLTQLKKKHSKTGEESRWQGTVLGKDTGEREIIIEGWEVENLQGWATYLKMRQMGLLLAENNDGRGEGEAGDSGSDSPLTEMTGSAMDSGFG